MKIQLIPILVSVKQQYSTASIENIDF